MKIASVCLSFYRYRYDRFLDPVSYIEGPDKALMIYSCRSILASRGGANM